MRRHLFLTLFIIPVTVSSYAQVRPDSVPLPEISARFFSSVDKKLDKYTHRLTTRTGKTLARLARWESRLKSLLEKVSPQTAQYLFAPGQLSFEQLYNNYRRAEDMTQQYRQQYDEYRDQLTGTIAYLDTQKALLDKKLVQPLKETKEKLSVADSLISNSEAIAAFIRQRRQQLLEQAFQYAGKSRYLRKISSEAWYYSETLRNYKDLFRDPAKAEEAAMKLLQQIPGFSNFLQQNSQLASLFRVPAGYGSVQSIAGLQTRLGMEALLTQRIGAAGPNALQEMRGSMQAAQAQISELKNKAAQYGGNSDADMPGFKPNITRTKTFRQRIVYDANLQFAKSNALVPTAADIALGVGYKLNDRSIAGIGASYRMGLGSWQRIRISHQGVGLRSYIDWQLKKQFYVSGGFEVNHQAAFSSIAQLRAYNSWQQAGLIGLSKKISIKSKWAKASKVQVLYDMLYRNHTPVGQPLIIRTGFSF